MAELVDQWSASGKKNLFSRINVPMEKTNVPNGCAEDVEAECKRYDKLIEDLGGIDIQLLGIGLDGHIGFNEPDEYFTAGTHSVEFGYGMSFYLCVLFRLGYSDGQDCFECRCN